MKPITRRLAALLTAGGLATASLAAHAEGQIRIAQQFGIVYLLLNVAQEQKLIEKHAKAAGAKTRFFQSNHEGEIIDTIAKWADKGVKFLVINPGGHTHVSVALRDSIAGSGMRAVEVHISNIYKREEFRHTSLTAPACIAVISGLGLDGYHAALRHLLKA